MACAFSVGICNTLLVDSVKSLQLILLIMRTTLDYTTLYHISLHYTKLHYTTLHYTTLHYTTLHYTTLHYTTLHYTTLHYSTPHCATHNTSYKICTSIMTIRREQKCVYSKDLLHLFEHLPVESEKRIQSFKNYGKRTETLI